MILRKLLSTSFVFSLLVVVHPVVTLANEASVVMVDQITPVHLCGVLKQKIYWGPPGFGETPEVDIKRLVWILTLNPPIVFRYQGDNGKKAEEKLTYVQISLTSSALKRQLHQVLGRPVLVTGPVWSASSEGDTTPVVIEMAAIARIAKPIICN